MRYAIWTAAAVSLKQEVARRETGEREGCRVEWLFSGALGREERELKAKECCGTNVLWPRSSLTR